MNILLIGGAGFIGLSLTKKLVEKHRVTIYDSLMYNQTLDLPNGITLIKDEVGNIQNHDISGYDIILYMASPRLLHLGNDEQITPELVSLKQTLDKLNKKTKFYFFSSCSVYGNNQNIVDEASPVMVTSFYSKLKIKSEKIIQKHSHKNKIILRLATLFGHSLIQRNDLLINNFIRDIKESNSIEIYDGNAWRPNIFIDDLVDALIKLIKIEITEPIINIGHNSLNITKNNLVNIISQMLNKNIKKVMIESKDTRSYKVNFFKLNSIIQHTFYNYAESIQKMIK
jgi:nucleoside-diphosphate-sugar epimerase